MNKILKDLLRGFIGFCLLFGGVTSVCADDDNDNSGVFMLEEITVTAQKREENLQKVPISMNVLYSDDIQELGKNDLNEILSTVSGAIIQKTDDSLGITIRGVGNVTSGSGQPGVAINIDGVTSNRQDSGTGLFDLERIEILYGPQSTLYATNSPGGVVNVVTASPKLDGYYGSASLELGNYDLLHTAGMVNIPFNETVAVRASFTSSVHDGFLTNGGEDEDSKSGRVRILYQPNERFSALLTGELYRDQGLGYYGGVAAFIDENDVNDPWSANEIGSLGENDQTRKKLYAEFNLDTPIASIAVIPSYNTFEGYREQISIAGNPNTSTETETNYNWQDSYEKGLEVRLTNSEDFLFDWIAGFIYYDQRNNNDQRSLDYIDTGVGEYMIKDVVEEIKSFFANVTYPFTDDLRITGGVRFNDNDYFYDTTQSMASSEEEGAYTVESKVQTTESPDNPDFKLGFEYDLNEDVMLYGSYGSSYRTIQKYRSLGDPELLKAYTIGLKSTLFNNRVQLNGSVYYYKYQNYLAQSMLSVWLYDTDEDLVQDDDESADDSGASMQGDGRMYGIDLQADWIISGKDKVNLAVSYEKSEWTDMLFDFYYTETLEVVNGELVTVPILDEDFSGKPMTLTPDITINLNYSHNWDLPNGGSITGSIDTQYMGDYRLTWLEDDYPYNYQEAFHKENISAVYAHSDGKWTLSAYVRNLLDYANKVKYSTRGIQQTLTVGDPRTYGVVLTVKF